MRRVVEASGLAGRSGGVWEAERPLVAGVVAAADEDEEELDTAPRCITSGSMGMKTLASSRGGMTLMNSRGSEYMPGANNACHGIHTRSLECA